MSAVPSLDSSIATPARRRHLHLVPSGGAQLVHVREQKFVAARPGRAVLMRRRFVALVALLMLVGGATFAAKAFAGAPASDEGVSITVRPGDTLSEIAAREMPAVRNDLAVVQFQQVNNLNSMHVQAGQHLVVPTR